MRLGLSYNVFDGEELLAASIGYIRKQVDYISVVYQDISNFGDECSPNLLKLLDKLVNKGYVDRLYKYTPEVRSGLYETNQDQEVAKRNIGLELSKENGCTHHMCIDVDEFYTDRQFAYMKQVIEEGDYDGGVCQHSQYYKEPIYRLRDKEQEYVATIYKIKEDTKFIYNFPCEFPIDPARKTNNRNYRRFSRDEVEMHHMSFVRKDLRKKFMSHTSRKSIYSNIDKVVDYYERWEYPMPAMWAGGNLIPVIKVEKQFDVYSENIKGDNE